MKTTKTLLCLLLCTVMVLCLLAACGRQSEETTPSSPTTESTTNTPTETVTEATTEPTETPTEPLPTEILSWTQNDFYIGDSVRTYDRQGNLIKEEKDFRYEDGSADVSITCYGANGNITEESQTTYFADSSLESYYHRKFDSEGNIIDYEYEYYFDDKSLYSKGREFYNSEQGVWEITSESYYRDGTPRFIWDGIFETQGGGLLEGIRKDFHDNGNLEYDILINPDGSGFSNEYREDRTPVQLEERTFDAVTNTLKTVGSSFNNSDGSISYYREEEDTYDTEGNVIKHIDYMYDDNIVYTHKWIFEYQYDTDGHVSWDKQTCYDSDGNKSANAGIEENFYKKYDSEGKCLERTKILDWGNGDITTTDYTYEYNAQGLVSKKHVVSVRSDIEDYRSEQFYEYEYNEQGLRTLEYLYDPYTDIRGDSETYTIYTYDENENCILVEVVEFIAGEQTDYNAFESDGSGYIYGEYGTRLYPYSDPLTDY